MRAARRRPWPPRSTTGCLQTEQWRAFASMRSPLIDICLSPGASIGDLGRHGGSGVGGARNRSYAISRPSTCCRPCCVCTKCEGDDSHHIPEPNGEPRLVLLNLGCGRVLSTADSVPSQRTSPERPKPGRAAKIRSPVACSSPSAPRATQMQPASARPHRRVGDRNQEQIGRDPGHVAERQPVEPGGPFRVSPGGEDRDPEYEQAQDDGQR
jgi:hypothetical protein